MSLLGAEWRSELSIEWLELNSPRFDQLVDEISDLVFVFTVLTGGDNQLYQGELQVLARFQLVSIQVVPVALVFGLHVQQRCMGRAALIRRGPEMKRAASAVVCGLLVRSGRRRGCSLTSASRR